MSPTERTGHEPHPLLHTRVRDIPSRTEGELVAVTREHHRGGIRRIAHIRPAGGIEFATSADNIEPAP
ncbi:hypothetical protein CP967_24670 [Streptomyces nitrosporeus]|uniref:Uncharacterized protein n=1 Tax=Streptomyces nitrosporeus TaxID=28894 RepID=A0A5J6FEK8_9ACTN|nr:hypothetical protein [Streptomyces nitrosporeus]QEU74752.1 hypothetical protein CP967_24670 [Streptomyces nitrosporeus]GGY85606.1 hypothetical protein GCM10010327_15290 [Streptomyces nitrosporeus]